MKTNIKRDIPEFTPIHLEITLESEVELYELFYRLNTPIQNVLEDNDYPKLIKRGEHSRFDSLRDSLAQFMP